MKIVFISRKPYEGASIFKNVLEHTTGAINIDATRIRSTKENIKDTTREGEESKNKRYIDQGSTNFAPLPGPRGGDSNGRWPANIILRHQPNCVKKGTVTVPGYVINRWTDGAKPFGGGAGHGYKGESFPDEDIDVWECSKNCAAKTLGMQSGITTSGAMKSKVSSYEGHSITSFLRGDSGPHNQYGDTGTASRFFKQTQGNFMDSISSDLINYLETLISPSKNFSPVIIVSLDMTKIEWGLYEDSSVHGMIVQGDPHNFMSEIDRILKPGAHLLLLSTEEDPTGHEGACSVEDFGYEVRDSIAVLDTPGEFYYVSKAPKKERHAGILSRTKKINQKLLFPKKEVDVQEIVELLSENIEDISIKKIKEGVDPEVVPDEILDMFEVREVKKTIKEQNFHPTVKPIKIMEHLLADVPNSSTVVDPFMGSGTTAIACLRTGHSFIGIEQDKEYLSISDQRVRYWDRAHTAWKAVEIKSEIEEKEAPLDKPTDFASFFGEDK